MNALGCYIFAGGFSIGVKQAGFDVLGHVEAGNYGVQTFIKNFDKQLAQAVQPPVGKWLATQIRESLVTGHRIRRPAGLIVVEARSRVLYKDHKAL